jgi:hypothetical protein
MPVFAKSRLVSATAAIVLPDLEEERVARTTMVTGWCSAVGGLAWTAACVVHNTQPTGCIDEGCAGHAMRDSGVADSALVVVAGVLLAASCAGLLALARAARPLGLLLPFADEQTSRVLLAVPFGLVWLATGASLLWDASPRRRAARAV